MGIEREWVVVVFGLPNGVSARWLPNGFVSVYDRRSQTTWLLERSGAVRVGYGRLPAGSDVLVAAADARWECGL